MTGVSICYSIHPTIADEFDNFTQIKKKLKEKRMMVYNFFFVTC